MYNQTSIVLFLFQSVLSMTFVLEHLFVPLTDFKLQNHEKKVQNFQLLITLEILKILQNNLAPLLSTPMTTK